MIDADCSSATVHSHLDLTDTTGLGRVLIQLEGYEPESSGTTSVPVRNHPGFLDVAEVRQGCLEIRIIGCPRQATTEDFLAHALSLLLGLLGPSLFATVVAFLVPSRIPLRSRRLRLLRARRVHDVDVLRALLEASVANNDLQSLFTQKLVVVPASVARASTERGASCSSSRRQLMHLRVRFIDRVSTRLRAPSHGQLVAAWEVLTGDRDSTHVSGDALGPLVQSVYPRIPIIPGNLQGGGPLRMMQTYICVTCGTQFRPSLVDRLNQLLTLLYGQFGDVILAFWESQPKTEPLVGLSSTLDPPFPDLVERLVGSLPPPCGFAVHLQHYP